MPPEATTCFLHNLFIEHILLGLLYLNVTRFRFSHVALRYDALTETVMNKELLTNWVQMFQRKHYVPPKRRNPAIALDGVTFHKIVILISL
jgi:hypothetical protein